MTMPTTRLIQGVCTFAAALSLTWVASPASASVAPSFSQVVAFGDSLSDNGNLLALTGALFGPANALPQASAYWQGRFSNGPAAVERLAQGLGVGLVNYAYGGATTGQTNGPLPGLPVATGVQAQVTSFAAQLAGAPAGASALYVVWAGANDIQYLGTTPAVVQQAIANLAGSVATLHALGARNFLLPNLPDLGLTPQALALNVQQPGTSAALSGLTDAFNAGLQATYGALAGQLGGATLFEVNVAQIQRSVAANPATFGFTNLTTPCFTGFVGEPGGSFCGDPTGIFYWDRVHPSAQAQALLGTQFLAAVPEPAAAWLLVAGLAGLAGWAGRRRA